MFESLTEKLGNVFEKLRGHTKLTEDDVALALREIRVALLEADVALPVVKEFTETIRERATGQALIKSVTPAQQVVKIVHDALLEMLGNEGTGLSLQVTPPIPVLMVGLQGSGKTTTTAKLARYLSEKVRKKVLVASLDTQRPAAQDQLRVLADQLSLPSLPIVAGQTPLQIAERAMETARLEGYDVVLLDTAGRLAIDEALMAEVAAVRDLVRPVETLLVVDAMTGQDAVNVAAAFNEKIGITGSVLTRVDGDARGGAALSMRAVTGKPIKFLGTGEKTDALEPFHPDRLAGRILGMGDVVSLVEKAVETIDKEEAEKMASKFADGSFDLNDMLAQFRQMKKMGGMGSLMKMLPGLGKLAGQIDNAKLDDGILRRQEALILSMTKAERAKPSIIAASRKRRIAAGSGMTIQDVNRLLKQHEQMQTMMKRLRKMGMGGMMKQMKSLMGGRDAAMLDAMQGMDPNEIPDLETLRNLPGASSGGLLGRPPMGNPFGGGMPGMGGFPAGFPARGGTKKKRK